MIYVCLYFAPLLAAVPDLPGVKPLSWRRSDLLTIELMQEHNIIVPITWDVRTGFNDDIVSPASAFIHPIQFMPHPLCMTMLSLHINSIVKSWAMEKDNGFAPGR